MSLLAALVLMLGSAPSVSLSAASSCTPREVLSQELSAAGVSFVPEGAVLLRLETDGKLTLEKQGRIVLARALGSGTCDELGRAAAVVIVRWVQDLTHAPIPAEPSSVKTDAAAPTSRREEPSTSKSSPAASSSPKRDPPSSLKPDVASTRSPKREEPSGAPNPAAPTSLKPELVTPAPVVASIGTRPPTTAVWEELPLTPTLSNAEEREKRAPVRVTSFEALAGGGLTAPGAVDVAPVISLELALVLDERWRIDLLGLFDFGGRVTVFDEAGLVRGALATRGGLVLPGAAYCLNFPLRLCFGAVAGSRIAQGEASGPYIFRPVLRRVGAFVFGPNAQLALAAGPFRAALDASLLVTPLAPAFSIDGLPTTLNLPVLQGLFRLSVGWGASR